MGDLLKLFTCILPKIGHTPSENVDETRHTLAKRLHETKEKMSHI